MRRTGHVDQLEFAEWFSAGPPPAPVLPQLAFRAAQQGKVDARGMSEHLQLEIEHGSADRAHRQFLQAVETFPEAQRLKRPRGGTKDSSAPLHLAALDASEHYDIRGSASGHAQSMKEILGMVPHFAESVSYMNSVETVERSAPLVEPGYRVRTHDRRGPSRPSDLIRLVSANRRLPIDTPKS